MIKRFVIISIQRRHSAGEANIADIPSREFDGYLATDLRRLRELGSYRMPMRLPTADQLQDLTCFLTEFQ